MLIDFFLHLKAKKLPVSTREFLTLLEALKEHVAGNSIDDFYFLRAPAWSRTKPTTTSSTRPSANTSRASRKFPASTPTSPKNG
jgi:hypothetical protein